MDNNKIDFKQAKNKQIVTISMVIFGVIASLFLIDTTKNSGLTLWLFLVLIASFFIFVLLRQQSKEALCPHCQTDLFEVIELARYRKVDFNYCPSCGGKVEL